MEPSPAEPKTVPLSSLNQWIDDVRIHFSRQIDQALAKRDLYQAIEAAGGRHACDQVRDRIEIHFRMSKNIEERTFKPRKRKQPPLPPWYKPGSLF